MAHSPAYVQSNDPPPTVAGPEPQATGRYSEFHLSFDERPTVQPGDTPAPQERVTGRIGPYELLEEIAHGGMGVVYKARHTILNRVVALKTIRPDRADGSRLFVERFLREARATAQLNHRHIVPIFDVGQDGDAHFFAMPLIPGGNLHQHRARFLHDTRAVVVLIEKVARAIQAAHDKGILHRDLKPSNILLDEAGEPLVADFGLAKFRDENLVLTKTGELVGTPNYMAPEQAYGLPDQVTPATDVWALGVILFELVTGRQPFPGKTSGEISYGVLTTEPRTPRSMKRDLDRGLETIILKCLEKNPLRRYYGAGALADDLDRWLRGKKVLARRRPWIRRHPYAVTAFLLFDLVGIGISFVIQYTDPDRPLKVLQSKLARGETVTLLGPTGMPAWSNWLMNGAILNEKSRNESFQVSSMETALLELMPDPQVDHFLFRAECLPEGTFNHIASAFGIYFSHEIHEKDQAVSRFYCMLTFQPLLPESNAIEAAVVYCHDSDFLGNNTFIRKNISKKPQPRSYRLAVEVHPDWMHFFYDDQLIGEISHSQLLQLGKKLKLRYDDNLKVMFDTNPDVTPIFRPRNSLGLYLFSRTGRFRNVELKPLPD